MLGPDNSSAAKRVWNFAVPAVFRIIVFRVGYVAAVVRGLLVNAPAVIATHTCTSEVVGGALLRIVRTSLTSKPARYGGWVPHLCCILNTAAPVVKRRCSCVGGQASIHNSITTRLVPAPVCHISFVGLNALRQEKKKKALAQQREDEDDDSFFYRVRILFRRSLTKGRQAPTTK